MPETMTSADAILQEDYLPGIRNQLNDKNQLLEMVEKNTEDVEGRRAVLSVHLARSGGIGARAAVGASLPTAGQQTFGEERIPTRHLYGSLKIELPLMEASRTDKASFGRGLATSIEGLTSELKKDTNRQVHGTSNGVIATCAVTGAVAVIVLDAGTTATQMRQFYRGLAVDIGTLANPTLRTSANVILSVQRAAKTITVTSAVAATAVTDFVFISGNGGDTANSTQKELTGIQSIIDATGAIFNLNPATAGQEEWASFETGTVGTNVPVSENLFATAMHEVAIASGEDITAWVTSYGVHRAYANLLTAQKRQTNTLDLKGGYVGLEVAAGGGAVALIPDRDCVENTAFGINAKHLINFQEVDWKWMDEDGAVLSRISGEPAYGATLYSYRELATDQRNAHAKIQGITAA